MTTARPDNTAIQPDVFVRDDAIPGDASWRVGYAGIAVDTWRHWVVIACRRQVVEHIVAGHHRDLYRTRSMIAARGYTGDDLNQRVAATTARLYFDGDILITDQRNLLADPTAINRQHPDPTGLYIVMGYQWPWCPATPTDYDRVIS